MWILWINLDIYSKDLLLFSLFFPSALHCGKLSNDRYSSNRNDTSNFHLLSIRWKRNADCRIFLLYLARCFRRNVVNKSGVVCSLSYITVCLLKLRNAILGGFNDQWYLWNKYPNKFVVAAVFSIWFGNKQKWIAIPRDIFTAFGGIHKGKIETLRISGRERTNILLLRSMI